MSAPIPSLTASAQSGATSGDSAQREQVVFGAVNFKSRQTDNRDTGGSPFTDSGEGAAPAGVPLWVWIGGGLIAAGVVVYIATRPRAS